MVGGFRRKTEVTQDCDAIWRRVVVSIPVDGKQVRSGNGIVVQEQQTIPASVLNGAAARRTGARIELAQITKGEGKLATPAECFRGIGGSVVDYDDFKVLYRERLLLQGVKTRVQCRLPVVGGDNHRKKRMAFLSFSWLRAIRLGDVRFRTHSRPKMPSGPALVIRSLCRFSYCSIAAGQQFHGAQVRPMPRKLAFEHAENMTELGERIGWPF